MPTTRLIFWLLVLGLVAYELLTLTRTGQQDTITAIIRELTTGRPIIPFVLGLLIGHLLWP